VRRGYADAAARIQELYLAGRKAEAADAVPDEFVDDGALVGPPARIRERFKEWTQIPITGMTINGEAPGTLELMAEIAGLRAPA
jgi:hypothetical protein